MKIISAIVGDPLSVIKDCFIPLYGGIRKDVGVKLSEGITLRRRETDASSREWRRAREGSRYYNSLLAYHFPSIRRSKENTSI